MIPTLSTSSEIGAVRPAAALAIVLLAPDGRVVEGNAAAVRLLGAAPPQDVREIRLPTLLGSEQRESFARLLGQVFGGGAGALELAVCGLDGELRWTQAHATPQRDERGEVRAAQVTLLDITERRRAGGDLGCGSRDFRTLAENIHDNVIFYDRQCRPCYVNPSMRASVAADILPVPGVTPAEQAPSVPLAVEMHRVLEEVLASGQPNDREVAVRNPSGELRTHHLRCVAARGSDDEIVGVISIGRNITAREARDDPVRASDDSVRKLSLAVEQSPASIIITDTSGRIEYVNAKFTEATGYAAAEVIGQSPRILKSGETPPQVYRELWQAITAGKAWRGEFHNRRKDGALFWELASVSPVFAADGTITHYLAVQEDITERKRLEEGLREADRRKNEFLSVLSHELRNPLAPIRNALHLMARVPGDAALVARAREVIERQAGHLSRLVDDLLDVTRITRGRIELHRELLDLARLVRDTVEDHRGGYEAAGIRVVVEVPPVPVVIEGDATRLAQVLGNLLSNAAKFTPRSGVVTVRVEREPGGTVLVIVRDTGEGIDTQLLPRLFEPFSQGDRSLARTRGGLGLGLAVVRGLVQLHGGTVAAASAGRGQGTEIAVRLPQATPVPPSPPPRRDAARVDRILVIEDNIDAAETLRDALELEGAQVRVADDGNSGLDAARQFRPDVIICDIGLPGELDGYDVARAIRADAALRDTPLIALTGYAGPEDLARAREAGFDRHLGKPASAPDVLRAVASFAHP
jgi:PAS domain S-box-containing protein